MILIQRLAIDNVNENLVVVACNTLHGGDLLTSVGYEGPRVPRGWG